MPFQFRFASVFSFRLLTLAHHTSEYLITDSTNSINAAGRISSTYLFRIAWIFEARVIAAFQIGLLKLFGVEVHFQVFVARGVHCGFVIG
jgi:hypothetical protein